MKVLFITGASLKTNSSATICNINYLKGFIENNYEVTVLMPTCLPAEEDKSIKLPTNVEYIEFNNRSYIRKIFASVKRSDEKLKEDIKEDTNTKIASKDKSFIKNIMRISNNIYKKIDFDPNVTWIKNASRYKCSIKFDLIISLSFPVSSHQVAINLIRKKRVIYNSWIQIWEDPWSNCLYAKKYSFKKRKQMRKTEEYLLSKAEKIVYVSPLTLENQKHAFSKYKNKMSCIVLPSDNCNNIEELKSNSEISCGYFGEYVSYVRNIMPFYYAVKDLNINTKIVGGSDIHLNSTEKIKIEGRVSYHTCLEYENEVDVLVNLSNLSGGQIPGKIYYYSATNKYILFVLDGTDEEKDTLYNFFKKYNRYVFCNNNEESIKEALTNIQTDYENNKNVHPIEDFIPKNIAKQLIDLGEI